MLINTMYMLYLRPKVNNDQLNVKCTPQQNITTKKKLLIYIQLMYQLHKMQMQKQTMKNYINKEGTIIRFASAFFCNNNKITRHPLSDGTCSR